MSPHLLKFREPLDELCVFGQVLRLPVLSVATRQSPVAAFVLTEDHTVAHNVGKRPEWVFQQLLGEDHLAHEAIATALPDELPRQLRNDFVLVLSLLNTDRLVP